MKDVLPAIGVPSAPDGFRFMAQGEITNRRCKVFPIGLSRWTECLEGDAIRSRTSDFCPEGYYVCPRDHEERIDS